MSAPFPEGTALIRVASDETVLIDIGHAPDAGKRGMLLLAGTAEYFGTQTGHRLMISEVTTWQ